MDWETLKRANKALWVKWQTVWSTIAGSGVQGGKGWWLPPTSPSRTTSRARPGPARQNLLRRAKVDPPSSASCSPAELAFLWVLEPSLSQSSHPSSSQQTKSFALSTLIWPSWKACIWPLNNNFLNDLPHNPHLKRASFLDCLFLDSNFLPLYEKSHLWKFAQNVSIQNCHTLN